MPILMKPNLTKTGKQIRKFLVANKELYNFALIERTLGMSNGYLNTICEKEYLPPKWERPLKDYVEKTFSVKL